MNRFESGTKDVKAHICPASLNMPHEQTAVVGAAQSAFVGGANKTKSQASKRSRRVAVAGRGSQSDPGKVRRLLSIWIACPRFFASIPPAIHWLLGRSKPVRNTPSKTKIFDENKKHNWC